MSLKNTSVLVIDDETRLIDAFDPLSNRVVPEHQKLSVGIVHLSEQIGIATIEPVRRREPRAYRPHGQRQA